jgi:hypothetical protein
MAIVVRASDRHRQLPSYLHSVTIFSRLLTRSNETELNFRFGRGIARCKIRKIWRATADEDGHYVCCAMTERAELG